MKPEQKFFSFMSLVGDIILINVLFIITSIPIFTIGASYTALFCTIKRRIKNLESYIIKDYFIYFKDNFKNATVIWLFLVVYILIMLNLTIYISSNLENILLLIIYFILFLILAFILLYAFPLQATFVNKPINLIKNSILTSFAHLPNTFIAIFVISIPMCITLYFPSLFYFTFAYWVAVGFSISAILQNLILNSVLDKYIK